jgi:hypothetical protein
LESRVHVSTKGDVLTPGVYPKNLVTVNVLFVLFDFFTLAGTDV